MGFFQRLADLFSNKPPQVESSLPAIVVDSLRKGILPVLNVETLILGSDEKCHYLDKSYLMSKKTQKIYTRDYGGSSFRITKGWYYRTGRSYTKPLENEIPVYTPGYFYITNKRIIFSAKEKGYEKKFSSLTSVIPYSDAIELQFGDKTYCMLLPTADSAYKAIQLLK